MTYTKLFIGCILLHVLIASVQGRSVRSTSHVNSDDGLWTPDDMSRSDWLACHGLPCDVYQSMQETLEQIFVLESGLTADEAGTGPDGPQYDPPFQVYPAENNGTLDGCIMLTPEQADWILQQSQQKVLGAGNDLGGEDVVSRQKRKITDFDTFAYLKWTEFPIVYQLDGKHSEPDRAIIRNAFQHWEEHTCVRFREAPLDENVEGHYVLITAEDGGCYSYVGKVPFSPQQINLQPSCLWEFGIPVHEIGHMLGLWHEQMRFDRDDYISIQWDNVGFYRGQFQKMENTVGLDVRYDYASVMHYSPKDGSFNGQEVMLSHDPLFQSTMGQRTGLSFSDAHIVNRAYCADVCTFRLPRECANNGYQDPNNCDICRCPDGLSGRYCEDVAPAANAACGGQVHLSSTDYTEITTPNYYTLGSYENNQECNWWIKAPPHHKVLLEFVDQFGLYCHHQGECHHWVEVRYNGELGQNGPRFCCHNTPTAQLESRTQDMLVVFRSNWTTGFANSRRGFKAILTAVREDPAQPGETTTTTTTTAPTTRPTTTPTTTTSSTTTPTTTTTTTTTPSTTTRKSGHTIRWSCDFEDASGRGTFRDMIQEREEDQFDWTLQTGSTPSQETGPNYAYSGQYYAYIEASNPRKRDDTAILHLPIFGDRGLHCLHFHYHMFGFHVNELRVIQTNNGHTGQLWSARKQQGNQWLEARVNVFMQETDRLSFVGIRGGEYSGDIALDAIELTVGICEENGLSRNWP